MPGVIGEIYELSTTVNDCEKKIASIKIKIAEAETQLKEVEEKGEQSTKSYEEKIETLNEALKTLEDIKADAQKKLDVLMPTKKKSKR